MTDPTKPTVDEILWSINPEEVDSTVEEAKAALSALIDEVIDSDTPHHEFCDKGRWPDSEHAYCDCDAEELNELRAEQRQRLKQRMGEK